MSRHSKAKKSKARDKAQAHLKEDRVKFDVISLLKSERLDTKPNMGKFLKQHVKMIRGLNTNSKISFYPSHEFDISKVFVKFLDGHELIYDMNAIDGKQDKFFLYFDADELPIADKDLDDVQNFFNLLFQFNFVFKK